MNIRQALNIVAKGALYGTALMFAINLLGMIAVGGRVPLNGYYWMLFVTSWASYVMSRTYRKADDPKE